MPRRYDTAAGRRAAVPAALHALIVAVRRDPARAWFAAGAALVAVVVLVASIAALTGRLGHTEEPFLVQPQPPALPAGDAGESATPPAVTGAYARPSPTVEAATATPGVSGAAGLSSRAPRERPSSRAAEPSRSVPPSPTKPPPPPADVTAHYRLSSTWAEGFVAGVEVTNTGDRPQTVTVTVAYDPALGVRVQEHWNAELTSGGPATVAFTVGPVAPGATLAFGFKASKTVPRQVGPTSCRVAGRTCRLG